MGYVLDGVGLPMREVVTRINAPSRSGAGMLGVQNAIEHRVTQVDVSCAHIDLRAQHACAIGKLSRAHTAKQIQIFLDRALAPRAVAPRLCQSAAGGTNFVRRLIIDIRLSCSDEMLGPFIQLLEIVRGVIEMRSPVKPKPMHVALDGIDIFLLLFERIGVVKSQVTAATKLLRQTEVEADGLGVPDMQIPIGLRRKTRNYRPMPLGLKIGANDVANEIACGGSVLRFVLCHCR